MSSNQTIRNDNHAGTGSRRKFVWGIGLLSFLTATAGALGLKPGRSKRIISCAPESHPRKLKMLTEDGMLVEIDASHIPAKKTPITDTELQQWIRK